MVTSLGPVSKTKCKGKPLMSNFTLQTPLSFVKGSSVVTISLSEEPDFFKILSILTPSC